MFKHVGGSGLLAEGVLDNFPILPWHRVNNSPVVDLFALLTSAIMVIFSLSAYLSIGSPFTLIQ